MAATISHQRLAEAYCKFLNVIDWTDGILVKGFREGRNKFLSNAFAIVSFQESTNTIKRI